MYLGKPKGISKIAADIAAQHRARNAVIVLNNPPTEPKAIDNLFELLLAVCVYAEFNLEHGLLGTPHWQGYCQFKNPMSLVSFKKIWPLAHFEVAMGSPESNICYIRKGLQPKAEWDEFKQHGENYGTGLNVVRIFGHLKTPGKRTDLNAILQVVQSGGTLLQCADANPEAFIKMSKGIQAYHTLYQPRRNPSLPKEVFVFYGPTGTGKTRTAYEENPGAYMWGPEQKTWFDNYSGQNTMILDEFRGQLALGFLLRLLDRYPMQLEVKGGTVQLMANKIIICSPVHPTCWYPNLESREGYIAQLLRRITTIKEFLPEPSDNVEFFASQFSNDLFGNSGFP